MHIPDGYLSPSTCGSLYAASAPFWYVALRRIRDALNAKAIPLLSVFAAFSFVIMMFNLPLPGGTTGHAVGMGMAAVVLGPWISILAISAALLIQALLFGDGGITTLGANCFNMAIVGSLVAFAVYRLLGLRASLTSPRRVLAAATAGYVGVNCAALCAAVEFGIQPMWFHDASGTPLYAPYPLGISIPAMMLGHLTFAGVAELILSASIVAYLQRTDPELLRATAPDAPDLIDLPPATSDTRLWAASRKLWAIVAIFLVLTPLGILAAGSAWGEWRARDFKDPAAREQIQRASGNEAPPEQVPLGIQRFSAIWRAPFSEYSPPFLRSAFFAYFICAMVGVGAIILLILVATWFSSKLTGVPLSHSRRRRSFLEQTVQHIHRVAEQSLFSEQIAEAKGLLQSMDARIKLIGTASLLVAAIAAHRLSVLLGLLGLATLLAVFSHISIRLLATRVWFFVLGFTGVIALPAVFLIPGSPFGRVPIVHWQPTYQGIASSAFLILRAAITATLIYALVLTTPWNRLLRALRTLGIPASVVIVLEMTYRYIFVLLQTAQDLFESRQTRLLGKLEPAVQRRLASSVAGALLDKSIQLNREVHLAMQARGFRGDVLLLNDLSMNAAGWMQLAAFLGIAASAVWLGR